MNNPLIYTDPSGYFSEATKDFIDRIASVLWGLPDGSSWSASGGFSIGHPDLSSGSKVSQYLEHSMSGGGGGTFRIRQLNVSKRNGSPLFPWVTGDGKLHKDPVIQLILEPILEPFLPELSYQANDNISFITRQSGDEPGGSLANRGNKPVNVKDNNNPIKDILIRYRYLVTRNELNHLNDLILNNGYGKMTIYGGHFKERYNVDGYTYELRIDPYSEAVESDDNYYYWVFRKGLGHLDQTKYNQNFKKTWEYYNGFAVGLYIVGRQDTMLLTIGADSPESFYHLLYLLQTL